MAGKKMEGNAEQRREAAREARRHGKRPSEVGATLGASKQRKHLDEDWPESLEAKRQGKQDVIAQNTPEPRPKRKIESRRISEPGE